MVTYTFEGLKGRAEASFTCRSCGKKNRKRSFVTEHTVNPFNKNDDGSVKTREQVRASARLEAVRMRDFFLTEPLCKSCEDALSYSERSDLRMRRDAGYRILTTGEES